MKEGGDDFSIFNHPKILELEKGGEIFRSFSNALFKLCHLPLRYLVLPQLLVFNFVILDSGFS